MKKMLFALVLAIIFACGQVAFAADNKVPVYEKDATSFVSDYNAAAKRLGTFVINDSPEFISALDEGYELYGLDIDDTCGALLQKSPQQNLTVIAFFATDQNKATQAFKTLLATLGVADRNIPEPTFKTDETVITLKGTGNRSLSVETQQSSGEQGTAFTISVAAK